MKILGDEAMKAHRELHRRVNKDILYEIQKKLWESEHPDADYVEHSKAMRAIADRLEI